MRYETKGLLAKGETTSVYHAVDLSRGVDVALRRFYPEVNQTMFNTLEDMFMDMCQRIASIKHANFVHVSDYGVDEDGPYIATQLVPASTFQEYIMLGTLNEEQALAFARHTLDALIACHSIQFIHGALHPTSILMVPRVDKEPLAMVQDLGIHYIEKILNGAKGGYFEPVISPAERFVVDEPTVQSDLYTLGNLIYMSLLGGHPFAKMSYKQACFQHTNHGLPSLRSYREDISDGFRQWLRWLLCVEPEGRPVSALQAYDHMPMEHIPDHNTTVLAPAAYTGVEVVQPTILQGHVDLYKPVMTQMLTSQTGVATQPLQVKPASVPQISKPQSNAAQQGKMMAAAQESEETKMAIMIILAIFAFVVIGFLFYLMS